MGLDNLKMVFKKNLRIGNNTFWENGMGFTATLAYNSEDT
jgi:hypothetical protein